MKLRLVDRRAGASATVVFRDLDLVGRLVAPLGRPDWVADLVLVDDRAMAELNGVFRGVSGVTDVLSFSYLLPQGGSEPDLIGGEGLARRDLWLDPVEAAEGGDDQGRLAGELILAPEFVTSRCRERGWPLEHELPLLLVHGCLHLLGWEHEQEEDRRVMQIREAELLRAVGLPHALVQDSPDR